MKDKKALYMCIIIFGLVVIYLTFINVNIGRYDSQAIAYRIDVNARSNSEGTQYYPIFYYEVNGKEYRHESKFGGNVLPNKNNSIVYYDSSNPEKSTTKYEKTSSLFMGIVFLIGTVAMIIIAVKESKNTDEIDQTTKLDIETNYQNNETIEKARMVVDKITLIIKRVILGVVILILSLFLLLDTIMIKQTIKSKDYIETVANFVEKRMDEESNVFCDYIYSFKDTKGRNQEIAIRSSIDDSIKNEIKVKYNENNPQDFYEEGTTYDKTEIIWYVVKICVFFLLVFLFFNKRLLNKIKILANAK